MTKVMVIGGKNIESKITRSNGEYGVRVREFGAKNWHAPCDYFTDDKSDAISTQVRMMHDYRETIARVEADLAKHASLVNL